MGAVLARRMQTGVMDTGCTSEANVYTSTSGVCVWGSVGVLCAVCKCGVLCANCVCAVCGAALVQLNDYAVLYPPKQTTAEEEEAVQSLKRTRKQPALNKTKLDAKPADMETECCSGAYHVSE